MWERIIPGSILYTAKYGHPNYYVLRGLSSYICKISIVIVCNTKKFVRKKLGNLHGKINKVHVHTIFSMNAIDNCEIQQLQ